MISDKENMEKHSFDTMGITIPTTVQLESACRREPNADALYGPGMYENITLRMECQELSVRNRIAEDLARSELDNMERDARFFRFFFHNKQLKVAVREYRRQARDAVNQAVRESSGNR